MNRALGFTNETIMYKWLLTIGSVEVVDVGIAKGTTGHSITANTNASDERKSTESRQNNKTRGHQPRHGSDHVENLEEHCLSDGGIEFANIEGGRGGRAG